MMAAVAFAVLWVSLDVEALARCVGDVRRRLVAFAGELGADSQAPPPTLP
jgi:hypothetical protein